MTRGWLRVAALLVATVIGNQTTAQDSGAQQAFWTEWQRYVLYELETDADALVASQPDVAAVVLDGLVTQWRAQRKGGDELGAGNLTAFIYPLARRLAARGDAPLAAEVAAEIKIAVKEFRDRFELYWRRRAVNDLETLVRDHRLAAYGCAGAMIPAYVRAMQEGQLERARYELEVLGPLVILIERLHEDPRPRAAVTPLPPEWKEPDLTPTFTPGSSDLGLADRLYRDALAREESGDLLAAVNGYLAAATILAKIGEAPGELSARTRAAAIAVRVRDWTLAGRLLPPVAEQAARAGQEQTKLWAEAELARIATLRDSGEVAEFRPPWELDEAFGPWRKTKCSLREVPHDLAVVDPALGANPIAWRWVAIGSDSTAILPLPGKPKLSRLGGDLWLDARLDGKASLQIIADGYSAYRCTLADDAGGKHDYALRLFASPRLEYLGVGFGLGGRDLVFFQTASMLEGRIDGTPFWIVDASIDGRWNTWEHDGFAVGRKPSLISRLSRVVRLGGELWQIDIDPMGEELRYRPYTGPRGTFDVGTKLAGAQLQACLMRPAGTSGVLLDTVPEAKGKIEVPAGQYVLEEAVLVRGSDRVLVRAGAMEALTVTGDQPTKLELARELRLEVGAYRAAAEPGEIPAGATSAGVLVIGGRNLVLRGALGEIYLQAAPQIYLPTYEVVIADAAPQTGSFAMVQAPADYVDLEVPADLRLVLPAATAPVRVRVSLDHPVLGRVVSAWQDVP